MDPMISFGYNSNGSVNVTSPFSPHTQEYTTSSSQPQQHAKPADDAFWSESAGIFATVAMMIVIALVIGLITAANESK